MGRRRRTGGGGHQAKRSGRGAADGRLGAAEKHEGAAFLRGQLQTAEDPIRRGGGKTAHQGGAEAGAEDFLHGPKLIVLMARAHQKEAIQGEMGLGQGDGIGEPSRVDPCGKTGLLLVGIGTEEGKKRFHDARGMIGEQDLVQGAHEKPPAQSSVEIPMAGGTTGARRVPLPAP